MFTWHLHYTHWISKQRPEGKGRMRRLVVQELDFGENLCIWGAQNSRYLVFTRVNYLLELYRNQRWFGHSTHSIYSMFQDFYSPSEKKNPVKRQIKTFWKKSTFFIPTKKRINKNGDLKKFCYFHLIQRIILVLSIF